MAKIKVAVIFGGVSNERNLSSATAAEVIRIIPEDKYEVIRIGITKKGRWLLVPLDIDAIADGSWETDPDCTSAVLSPDPFHRGFITIENGEASIKRVDVVFPLLQGKFGADGSIQGLLDMSHIPYVGCGLLASASCTDKSHTHMVLDDYGIKTAEWRLITQRELNDLEGACDRIAAQMPYPLIVKPAKSGSSIGSSIAHNKDEFLTAVKIAFSNDNKVVVEKYVRGRKLEAAVFGYDNPFSSYIGEIMSPEKEYDPTQIGSGDDLVIPADLSDSTHQLIRQTAVSAYKALGCKGMARVEFFLTDDGELLLNKIITSPGLRCTSVYPQLMEHLGMSLQYLIDKLLEQAIENSNSY
ncbi:MAG: D-alanine--D-alanine ligase [Ruminococcus sp.]|nr:D-alanine--D-alanine ligase [Ruminococcus sp.]